MLREEQGQGHRVAWLGRDLERSSSSKPPDMDRITRLSKAVMERLDNKLIPPAREDSGLGRAAWNRDGTRR